MFRHGGVSTVYQLPLLPGGDDRDRSRRIPAPGYDPGTVSGDRDAAAEICLSGLQGRGGARTRAAAAASGNAGTTADMARDAGPSIMRAGINSTLSGAPIATAAALRADRQL